MGGVVTICDSCEGEGAALAAALDGAVERAGWRLRRHACFSACAAPVAVAVQDEGRATYLFAGLGPDDAGDIVAFLALFDAAPGGWVEDARPAGRLRFCLRARVPAL